MNDYGIGQIVSTILSLTDTIMKKLPDYDQKKKETFYKFKRAYENERSKDYKLRDDNLLDFYRERLLDFAQTFSEEINK